MELISSDFQEGNEIPKKFGYKHENEQPNVEFGSIPDETKTLAIIMDDPDAMKAVGKVWVHWLEFGKTDDSVTEGKNDFGEIGYGGPAPPDGRHTYMIQADAGQDLRDAISQVVIGNGWSLRGLQMVGMSLEEIFLRLTTQEEL